MRRQEAEIAEQVEQQRADLDAAVVAKRAAEEAAAEEDKRIAGLQRAAADRREGLARLTGQVNALTSRSEAADAEIQRLTDAREDAVTRAERAQRDFTALETRVAGLDAGEEGLDSEHEDAVAALDEIDEQLARAREEAQQAERERAGLVARRDALEIGLNRKDGAGALLAATDEVGGLLGSVAALLDVDHGYETAVAAALGAAADAVVVSDAASAVEAIAHLKHDDLGRAGMLLGGAPAADRDWPALPDGAVYAVDVVSAPDDVRPAVARLLHQVAVVDDLPAARRLVAERPDVVAVTREGDLLGAHFAAGGSTSQPSLIEIQAAVDEAGAKLAEATASAERLGFEISRLEAARHDALKGVDVALAKLHESDATLAAVAEELGQYGSQARAAKGEADRLERAITTAREAREADLAGLVELEARLAAAQDVTDEEPDTADRERLAEAAREARQAEMDARLALRTAEERARALNGRADSLLRAAQAERESRARAAERRERLIREGAAAKAVSSAVRVVLHQLERSVMLAADERAAVEESRRGSEQELMAVRTHAARPRPRARRARQLRPPRRDGPHPAEDAHRAARGARAGGARPGPLRPGRRLRPGHAHPVHRRGARGRGAAGAHAVRARGAGQAPAQPPSVPCRCSAGSTRSRWRSSPRWRSGTSSSPSSSRTSSAPARTSSTSSARSTPAWSRSSPRPTPTWRRPSTRPSRRLFPGGEGRLVLTDPGDMLTTGVEVEARPPGKKVKRLSLLSGGERSLVAVAFLVALFKARPSPFYILDEVEAALDDTNLGRLLEIYEELRENSQLLVITHQKRTMEVGDALYGVTMRGDGVSAVISQRLRDAESA